MKDEYAPAMIDWQDSDAREAAVELIVSVFDDPVKYTRPRIASELTPLSPPHDRKFFAVWIDGRMAGVGGIKTADWVFPGCRRITRRRQSSCIWIFPDALRCPGNSHAHHVKGIF